MRSPQICGTRTWVALFLLALAGTAGALDMVDDTKFSVKRGFFDSPFLLEISTDTPGATVRYTTDSSEPTLTNGLTYYRPVVINRTTVVRAAAFKDEMDSTDVDTQTYLFLDDVISQTGAGFPTDWGDLGTFGTEPGNHPPGPHAADYAMDPDVVQSAEFGPTIHDDMRAIPSLSVVLDRRDLFSPEVLARDEFGEVTETRGIYLIGKGFERAASVELLLPDGGDGFQINSSLEIQGATSTDRWKTAKLSMRLKFKAPYGPSELDYPLFGDDASDNVNTVILDSTNQQSWTHPITSQQLRAQYVRDQFVGDLQNAMGGIAPHGRYAHVYLDGLYWGVYWMHEFVEEAFAVAYRGGQRSDFDIMRHRADNAIAGNADNYNAMIAAASGDLSPDAALEEIESYLDLGQFADYILVNFYAGNADWAFQNWNASRNRVDPDSRWLFHNWDGEKTFQDVTDDNTGANDAGAPTFLHQQLLANDEYRLIFADRVHRHCFNGGVLTPAEVIQRYQWRTDMIERAVVGESARWGDNRNPDDPPYTRANWVTERDRLLDDYFPTRTNVLLAQLRADDLYPTSDAPDFSQHGGEVAAGSSVSISHTNPSGTIFYTTDGSDPRGVGATSYTGAITINSSLVLRARVLAAGEWSALNEAFFQVSGGVSALRVTEINFHPGAVMPAEDGAGIDDEDSFEFIEVRNTGAQQVQLRGVLFSQGIDFEFGDGMLGAGDSVIVVNDRAAFELRYGAGVVPIVGEFSGTLANSGETIELRGGFGELIQSFTYDDRWYPPTDGGGATLVVEDDSAPTSDWDLAAGWRPSTFTGGSPGAVDVTPIPLRITEVNYHPEGPTDAEKDEGFDDDNDFEFVEIRNIGTGPVALGGVMLSNAIEFTFPASSLASGAYVIVARNTAAFGERYGGGINVAGPFTSGTLSDSGERIVLTGPAGESIHDFEYSDDWYTVTDSEGASLVIRDQTLPEHTWEESESWRASVRPGGSPGELDPTEPPTLRVTEIMYHPAPETAAEENAGFSQDDFDFIEFTNTGEFSIQLAGYTLSDGLIYTFPNITLNAGARILLVEDDEAFAARYGPGLPVVGSFSGSLSNGDDRIVLKLDDLVVQDFTYKDGWYPTTDGTGPSLTVADESAHPLFWNDDDGWRPSGESGGTPGRAPGACAAWLWEYFSEEELADPQIGDINADPDGDGLTNLMEFALALDPKKPQRDAADRGPDIIEIGGDYFLAMTLRRDQNADDALLIRAEISSDLTNWSGAAGEIETYIVTDLGGGLERVTFRDLTPIDLEVARRFLRISVAK